MRVRGNSHSSYRRAAPGSYTSAPARWPQGRTKGVRARQPAPADRATRVSLDWRVTLKWLIHHATAWNNRVAQPLQRLAHGRRYESDGRQASGRSRSQRETGHRTRSPSSRFPVSRLRSSIHCADRAGTAGQVYVTPTQGLRCARTRCGATIQVPSLSRCGVRDAAIHASADRAVRSALCQRHLHRGLRRQRGLHSPRA